VFHFNFAAKPGKTFPGKKEAQAMALLRLKLAGPRSTLLVH
jgi:hypothetical protein